MTDARSDDDTHAMLDDGWLDVVIVERSIPSNQT